MSSPRTRGLLDDLHRERGARWTSVWDHQMAADFGDPHREKSWALESVGLVDESFRAVLDLEGEAVAELLDRIVSSHPENLEPGDGQPSTLLTAKGRLVGAFLLFRLRDEAFRLVCFDPPREELFREIQKYAFLSDVEVVDRTGDVALLTLRGPRAGEMIREGETSLPSGPGLGASLRIGGESVNVIRGGGWWRRGPGDEYDIWVDSTRAETVARSLLEAVGEAGGGAVGWTAAESLRIAVGFARWNLDYTELSFPNEVGWEEALSYDKCYVGQEIVARMNTYGSQNRRLFRVAVEGDTLPEVGSIVCSGEDKAGKITSVDPACFRSGLALGMIRRRFWDDENLVVKAGGQQVRAVLEPLRGGGEET